MKLERTLATALLLIILTALHPTIARADTPPEAKRETYAKRGDVELAALVVEPTHRREPVAAVAIFHGGGWTIGEASWGLGVAQRFADAGALAVSFQYRLSDGESVTPLEAMADARDAIRWLRTHADRLKIDPDRVAVYGWSAGAHLGMSAAMFGDDLGPASKATTANALVLLSPAVAVGDSGYFERLLLGRAHASDASPDAHVRPGLPPTLILQGDVDTVTPRVGVERFCDRMVEAGNRCELALYEGYGHLFTPAGTPDDGWPQADPDTREAALKRAEAFLRELGFFPGPTD